MTQEQTRHHRTISAEREEAIRERIGNGFTDKAVAQLTDVDRRTVGRIRRAMGMPPTSRATTKEFKLKRDWRPHPSGHTLWVGRRYTSGGAAIRQNKQDIPASHVAFELRTGRTPVGIVKVECGEGECLTPEHLSDEIERRKVRMQERALYGLDPAPWDICPKGKHTWDESGRVEPDLTPYCKSCNTERAAESRARRNGATS